MKSTFLFPHKWRLIGYLCFAADIVFAIVLKIVHPQGFASTDLHRVPGPGVESDVNYVHNINVAMRVHGDIVVLLVVFGLLLVAFAKEKIEDEQIAQIRLHSLQWAVYLNYAIFIVCVIFVYGFNFIPVVIFNVITPMVFFIVRFQWRIYMLNRSINQN